MQKMIEENKIQKVLYNQVSFVIAITGVVISLMVWVTNPQVVITSRVQAVEQSLTEHKETAKQLAEYQVKQNEEIKLKLASIEMRQIEMLQAIARLQATKN